MKFPGSKPKHRGFALVVTLSLMILLTVIAVGMLSLSAISLRATGHGSAQAAARANARLALCLAIGELQKQAGPDQRVTGTASLAGSVENPSWTGVWRSDDAAVDPGWLVSGVNPDPTTELAENKSALLLGADPGNPESKEIRAALVKVSRPGTSGHIAWWVGDEGVKARVDLAKPDEAAASPVARLGRAQSPLEPGLMAIGSGFEDLGPDSKINKSALITMATASLAVADTGLPRAYFDDLTTGGAGLPVNVAAGRLKTDLSLLFDRSQAGETYIQEYLGASGNNGSPSQQFTISSPEKFYLSETIRNRVASGTGPNWGNLWNYAGLWKSVSDNRINVVNPSPKPESDVRTNDWLPYERYGAGQSWVQDIQHSNSQVSPVVSLLQIGFRLKTKPVPPATPGGPQQYQLQMQFKPVIGIWNPYNAEIRNATYVMDWGIFPWLRYASGDAQGSSRPLPDGSNPVAEVWMRDQWKIKEPDGQTRFRLKTEQVNLLPGEFRLFSVTSQDDMVATNLLKSAWNEDGAFECDLLKADGKPARMTATIPGGGDRYVWIGDLFLDDLQNSPATRNRFPTIKPNSTHSYLTLKVNGDSEALSRFSDFWNSGSGATVSVPERVLSGANSGRTDKAKYRVVDLAREGGHQHLATWSFFLRTTTQMEEANQRVRGWIDSNPRALASNPRWDGSTVNGGTRQGWHFTSAFMGGAHGTGLPAKVVGDGAGGNRGLVSEASEASENVEPQVGDILRYQGLGGASTTAVGGQPNVMIYDIPRSPLVSIGQFQHAQLSRYNFEPGFVLGNSYANPRIPLDATKATNFSGVNGLDISDISHEINTRIWDDFFFSTLGLDYQKTAGSAFDEVFAYQQSAFSLPNPRMLFSPESGDNSIDGLIAKADGKAPELISSRIRIAGAFNINSTSVNAWKAVLASMGASELPRIDPSNPAAATDWEKPQGTRFNRFGHVATAEPFTAGSDGQDPAFWLGWRELTNEELDDLATAIVAEVKARGPFRSLAGFVNRNPSATDAAHQRKGPLQAALDRTVNAALPSSVSDESASRPPGPYSDAVDGESQAAGNAGFLLQGDLLQSLGPILQARSDYFRVRGFGEALDVSGKVVARACCEAFVQRVPSYINPAEGPETGVADLAGEVNKTFGRRFDLVSFRWLAPSEISTVSNS